MIDGATREDVDEIGFRPLACNLKSATHKPATFPVGNDHVDAPIQFWETTDGLTGQQIHKIGSASRRTNIAKIAAQVSQSAFCNDRVNLSIRLPKVRHANRGWLGKSHTRANNQ